MHADEWANLLSWPCIVLTLLYCAGTWRRYRMRRVSLELALLATLSTVAALGFLLRPLTALGALSDPERDAGALVVRVLFLIVMGGLVWNLIDHWRDERRMRRDS